MTPTTSPETSPEIGATVQLGATTVNYHDVGEGPAVLLIHGSGPGVSAWANWRLLLPELGRTHRVIAPDMIGFGYTESPEVGFDLEAWLGQLTGLLGVLGIERCHVVGNSFGGAMALRLALARPELVDRLVLMGPAGLSFPITDGLEAVWGYEPSLPAMDHLVRDVFTAAATEISDDLVALRLAASRRPGVQERYAALFPPPRQRWVDALGITPEQAASITHPTLVVHGEEDAVVPLEASRRLVGLLPDARLEPIADCGHWVQVEQPARFHALVEAFLGEA